MLLPVVDENHLAGAEEMFRNGPLTYASTQGISRLRMSACGRIRVEDATGLPTHGLSVLRLAFRLPPQQKWLAKKFAHALSR